jgi:hypothetical protein
MKSPASQFLIDSGALVGRETPMVSSRKIASNPFETLAEKDHSCVVGNPWDYFRFARDLPRIRKQPVRGRERCCLFFRQLHNDLRRSEEVVGLLSADGRPSVESHYPRAGYAPLIRPALAWSCPAKRSALPGLVVSIPRLLLLSLERALVLDTG